jgi:cellulose synthase/poly-beta-1,6-N-acetylglucosamine synthase-like glycosyltransferase
MALDFSIIVPTRNRRAALERCLAAVAALEYDPASFEMLVIDDGSQPPVADVVEQFAGRFTVRCLRAEGGGPARARNMALRIAKGDYVAFTDDDCRPDARWLQTFRAAIDQQDAGARERTGFGGRIVDAPQNGICGRASQMLVSYLYEYNEASGGLRFFCSNNMVFPRRTLLEIGGFDESFPLAAAEDRYICARWLKDHQMLLLEDAVIEHRQMLDFRGFVRQQFRYGRGAFQFWQRMASLNQKNRLEGESFYRRMLVYPFGKVGLPQALVMSLLLALSQASVAAGYYTEKWLKKPVNTKLPDSRAGH